MQSLIIGNISGKEKIEKKLLRNQEMTFIVLSLWKLSAFVITSSLQDFGWELSAYVGVT